MFRSVLSDAAQDALALLGKSKLVEKGYLAGGSALALHFGHRYSLDFDFFSQESFDPRKLSRQLQKLGNFVETLAKGISLIGIFQGVKFSYFQYEYSLIAKTSEFLEVSIADVKDIAAMKIAAIMDRGTKRDFIDIYEMIRKGMNLENIFKLYDQKYHTFETNEFSIIKSLGYFDDAEASDIPQMIKEVRWEQVKDFFAKESMKLAKKYL